ncbi:hypothetical protein [Albidovulum sp.]|uniref:oxidoreductase n=1 Tax=Albidovulum sp. TaxID=1872424 RepID=UPI0039B8AF09
MISGYVDLTIYTLIVKYAGAKVTSDMVVRQRQPASRKSSDLSASFSRLISSLAIRGHEIRNRILSTGHQTWLAEGNRPSKAMIAYREARARAGTGLIVNEAARFHPSAIGEAPDLTLIHDDAIPHYARLAAAVHRHGAKIFGQLAHPGRVTRRMTSGMRGVVWAPSSAPETRGFLGGLVASAGEQE